MENKCKWGVDRQRQRPNKKQKTTREMGKERKKERERAQETKTIEREEIGRYRESGAQGQHKHLKIDEHN